MIKDGEEIYLRIGSRLDYEGDDEVAPPLLELPKTEQSTPYVALLEQARKILDHMYCAMDDLFIMHLKAPTENLSSMKCEEHDQSHYWRRLYFYPLWSAARSACLLLHGDANILCL